MAIIISGFSGTGKTNTQRQYLYPSFDLDSAKFQGENGATNLVNEVKHILAKTEHPDTLIFVPTHPKIREALLAAKLHFVLVFPSVDCKEEYRRRLHDKGMSPNTLHPIMYNWETLIVELSAWGLKNKIPRVILSKSQYLIDVLPMIKSL